jgi:hypothetical protein
LLRGNRLRHPRPLNSAQHVKHFLEYLLLKLLRSSAGRKNSSDDQNSHELKLQSYLVWQGPHWNKLTNE